MWGLWVQVILVAAVIFCLGIAIVGFVRMSQKQEGEKTFVNFLLVELAIFLTLAVSLWFFLKEPKNILAILIFALLLTPLANLPVAIIAKIIISLTKKKD